MTESPKRDGDDAATTGPVELPRLTAAEPSSAAPEPDAGYALAEPEQPSPIAPPSTPSMESEGTFQAATGEAPGFGGDVVFPAEPPAVNEVWSRWLEWKYPLFWSGAGMILAIAIVVGGDLVAFITFALALAYGAYQVVITLEIPVRVTPEQAVREFYLAVGHRLPHFRRMYALLTTRAKESDEYADFAGFAQYWKSQIARVSRQPPWLVPLEYVVEGFTCHYNGEKSIAQVKYHVKVAPRGRGSARPDAEFHAQHLVVKGPDGQWYMDSGLGMTD